MPSQGREQSHAESPLELAAQLALALVVRHLTPPHRVGDARVFTAGRLGLWSGWSEIADAERQRIARFLWLRPEALCADSVLRRAAHEVLECASRFRRSGVGGEDVLGTEFEPTPGKPLDQVLEELLEKLEASRRPAAPNQVKREGRAEVRLKDKRTSYTIPAVALPQPEDWPRLRPARMPEPIVLEKERLVDLAERIDRSLGPAYHRKALEGLFEELVDARAEPVSGSRIALPAGPTGLFVSRTGSGKSILSRIAALDWALRGIPVALVVPDIATTLREARQLERLAEAVGRSLRIVPINSVQKLFEKTLEILARPPSYDPRGEWTLGRLGYCCELSAYADEARQPGQEPCLELRQQVAGKERSVACPFAARCPKMAMFREAAEADILVVNHKALAAGRVPLPLEVEGGAARISVLELVLRRCAVLLIDEVDQFQHGIIEQSTGDLALASRPDVSPLHDLFDEFERGRSGGMLPLQERTEQVRRPLMLVRWLSEELAESLSRGDISWDSREGLRWCYSRDGWLAARLYGDGEEASGRFGALFDVEGNPVDEPSQALRASVRRLMERTLDEDERLDSVKGELLAILGRWPRPLDPQPRRVARTRDRVADNLILRAMLERLDGAIEQLRPQLGRLEQHGLESTQRVRSELLGYVSWRPSPSGPLGRRVVGFSFRQEGETSELSTRALSGDPHGFVAGLGDEVALAITGERRVVLGLSATARFRGSSSSDVCAPILFAQPDRSDTVSVQAAAIPEPSGDGLLKVSGVLHKEERLEEARRMGEAVWHHFLREHLAFLSSSEDHRARARVLLVTLGYEEAEAVLKGLVRALPGPAEAQRRIRCLVPKARSEPMLLPRRELASFPESGADILIAPLLAIARGHNLLQPGTDRSAISSIFVLVRPVPPIDDAVAALGHVSYRCRLEQVGAERPGERLEPERRFAEKQLRHIQQSAGPFSSLPADLRHQVLCNVLVELAQLAGRCRRGGTDVRLYLVDGAFQGETAGWARLVHQSFERWRDEGQLNEMKRLHGAYLKALARFADFKG